MPKRDGGNSKIYQIKVTLRYIEPPIWRRFHIARDASLWELHEVLQRVMGWGHDHLYQFLIKGKHYGEPFEDLDFEDAIETQLSQVVSRAGSKFVYEYDFGDGWEHELHVESTIPDKPGTAQPACIDGQRSCPPEDCGGVWGY